jgi:hypothetical protein
MFRTKEKRWADHGEPRHQPAQPAVLQAAMSAEEVQ